MYLDPDLGAEELPTKEKEPGRFKPGDIVKGTSVGGKDFVGTVISIAPETQMLTTK